MLCLLNVWWSIKTGSSRKRFVLIALLLLALFILLLAANFLSIGILFLVSALESSSIKFAELTSLNLEQGRSFLIGSGIFIMISTWVLARVVLLVTAGVVVAITAPDYSYRLGARLQA